MTPSPTVPAPIYFSRRRDFAKYLHPPKESWWVGLSRPQFYQRVREEAERMSRSTMALYQPFGVEGDPGV